MYKKILIVFGTRPEAIKMASVIKEIEKHDNLKRIVCVTAQHRQMLDQVLKLFDILPDIDLDLMTDGQALADITARVVSGVDKVITDINPDLILVQGDTTTVMAASLSAFYRQVPVGHVEAGLRSGDILSPFPEEMNRRVAGLVSSFHFAPTQRAVDALIREDIPQGKIFLTGNTVIDALQSIISKGKPDIVDVILKKTGILGDGSKKLILVTAHRRENFGEKIENICEGLKKLVQRNEDVVIIYPVHMNPNIREPIYRILDGYERIVLIDPVEYDVLAHLMKASYLVLTDSGGIQEEAPSFGKPVLVMRTETERPEGIVAGTAKLVGPFAEPIVNEAEMLLRDVVEYKKMSKAVNPYGDGKAAERIVDIILTHFFEV